MGQKDKILDDVKQAEAKRDGLKIEDYQKKATEKYAVDKDAEKGVVNNAYDTAKVNAQATHDKAVNDTNIEYESQYERNAVQKLINEKQVAEKMANLGLTDGGLNRTQQTAVQLSYANQKGKLDLAKRSALDGLSLNLTSALREIETNRNIDLFEVDQKWKDRAYSEAQTNYNNDVANYNSQIASGYEQYGKIAEAEIEAEAKTRNAAIEAEEDNKILLYDWKGETVVDDNSGLLLRFTGNDGKIYNVAAGKNPYTNSHNAKISNVVNGKCVVDKEWAEKNKNSNNAVTRACAKYGVFSNGYQPKGVCYYDNKGNVVDAGGLKATTRKDYMNGKLQTVWHAEKTDTYWIWDGTTNEYLKYEF